MLRTETFGQPRLWQTIMLYAGIVFNAVLLQLIGCYYPLAAEPWSLIRSLTLCAVFLCIAIFYIPIRLGHAMGCTFEELIEHHFGSRAAWVVRRLLVPVWAAVWFATMFHVMLVFLGASMWTDHMFSSFLGIGPHLLIGVVWLIMIAPAASAPFLWLPRSSVFVVKVSIVIVIGLMISAGGYAQQTVDTLNALAAAYGRQEDSAVWALPLERHLLLWMTPPLLLMGTCMHAYRGSRRALMKTMLLGIALPVVVVTLAGIITMAGAASIDHRYWKIPNYFDYAGGRLPKIGWVKLLLLWFTLLTASRIAANLVVGAVSRQTEKWRGAAITAVLLIVSIGSITYDHARLALDVWRCTAIPFAPLAGVLCGAFAIKASRSPDRGDRAIALSAWAAGCAATCIPWWITPYSDASGVRPTWIILGWFVSFATVCLARLVRTGSAGDQPALAGSGSDPA